MVAALGAALLRVILKTIAADVDQAAPSQISADAPVGEWQCDTGRSGTSANDAKLQRRPWFADCLCLTRLAHTNDSN